MTTDQLALDLSPIVEPTYGSESTIAERFAEFHATNPHVADVLESLAARWLSSHDRVGIKALYEVARWESGIQTVGSVWKLNNDFTALYARLLIERRPEWSDAFHLRERRAA